MLDSIFEKDDFKTHNNWVRFKKKSPTRLQERPIIRNQIYTNFGFEDQVDTTSRNFVKLNS